MNVGSGGALWGRCQLTRVVSLDLSWTALLPVDKRFSKVGDIENRNQIRPGVMFEGQIVASLRAVKLYLQFPLILTYN